MSWLEKLLPPKIQQTDPTERRSVPEGLWIKCPACETVLYNADLAKNVNVCPKCSHHHRIGARARLDAFLDAEGRYEIGQEVHTAMTVISYPPFGTQFKVKKRKSKKLEPMIEPQQRPHAKKKAAAAAAAGSDAPLQTTTIPLPVNLQHTTKKAVREQQARIQKDIQAMQTHIHSLESKLARTRGGNGNSEHLMQEVLRRLQARV